MWWWILTVLFFLIVMQLQQSPEGGGPSQKNQKWIKYNQLLIVEQIYHYWLLDGIKKML